MLLDAQELRKNYRRGDLEFTAVNGVSFSISEGELLCITGSSGSGKTTLLNMITGLLPPDSGRVFFEGAELTAMEDTPLSFLRNAKIAYIPQGRGILANFSVLDNVRLPFYLHPRKGEATARANALLAEMGIAHLSGQYPDRLSGGELRRVAIARSLINAPRLLVADEPTGDLDPENSLGVMRLFSRVAAAGTAVLLVTHDTENIRHASRRLKMEAGSLIDW
jgi:putative ABC transport system ATP-binding protein